MMIISLIGKLCSEWNWKITEKYCKILKIQKILKSGENNDDDITGRKAMQADGIGRANTQFDGQCNFLCSPLFPLAIITSNSITKMAQRKSSSLINLMSNGLMFINIMYSFCQIEKIFLSRRRV